ncbi:hypothetical protein HanIR_Chr05g0241771 [Helianthus annuus]|nr:hypothetical protein HanIR_Chr05g0241771 [Helianthus annuus]
MQMKRLFQIESKWLLREVLCVSTIRIHASLKLHGVGKSVSIWL